MNTQRFRLLTLAALALAASSTAFAQTTITHDKALAGGVTPGDTAGYPVHIYQPGHYKLMSNLVVPAGATGIAIVAQGVTLDLNGFSIIGPGSCTRTVATKLVTCTGIGASTIGVLINDGVGVAVRNGTIRGFGTGILSYGGSGGEKLVLMHNNLGINIGANVSLNQGVPSNWSDLIATLNGHTGVLLQGGNHRLYGINSSRNGNIGIHITGADSVLIDNSVVAENYTFGIAKPTDPANILAVRGSQVIKNANGLAQYQVDPLTNLGGNQFQ